jgi:hypothetical protein
MDMRASHHLELHHRTCGRASADRPAGRGPLAHAEAAGVDISTYLIAAAVQQMIRDDQAAASFATIDAEIAAETAGSGKVA